MGHHSDPNKYEAYRDATQLQRRIATFVLVFSVMIVALIMTFSAVQFREAPCQDRAHEILFETIANPTASRDEVVSALQDILTSRRGSLDFPPKNDDESKLVQLEVLDTAANLVSSHGFRLVRRTDGSRYRFDLRAQFDRLCGTSPSVSMEVMANVDYEKVMYHIKGIALANGTVKYLQQSSLATKEQNRVTTVAQLQSVFPGFHEFAGGAARLATTQTIKYTVEGTAQVYFNGSPLDLFIEVQHWSSDKDKPLFWRVVVSTANMLAETDLSSLHDSIQKGFAARSLLCGSSPVNCADQLDFYLR